MNITDCREKFEAMVDDLPRAHWRHLFRCGYGYRSPTINDWWRVWQTAWRLSADAEKAEQRASEKEHKDFTIYEYPD